MNEFYRKLALLSSVVLAAAIMTSAQYFDTNFVELDTSKMISTNDNNYAIQSQNFPSNWRCVSVNGDDVTIVTRDNQVANKKLNSLTSEERSSLESNKASLMSVIRLGPFNVKSQTGLSKLTTFDRNGGTSSMGSGGGSSSSASSSSSSSSSGGMSVSRTGKDSFIVSKQDFPFNWQRVFVNEDLVTLVYRDAKVIMMPQDSMRPEEKARMVSLRQEVDKSAKVAEKINSSFAQSFKNPMDFVNKAFGGLFG